jgi:hypothetical protein
MKSQLRFRCHLPLRFRLHPRCGKFSSAETGVCARQARADAQSSRALTRDHSYGRVTEGPAAS